MESFKITDFDDKPIEVGTRVAMWDNAKVMGTVTDLGEFDGDVDDEGRSYAICPRIEVKFDDGSTESFVTSEWDYEGTAGQVEELDAVIA